MYSAKERSKCAEINKMRATKKTMFNVKIRCKNVEFEMTNKKKKKFFELHFILLVGFKIKMTCIYLNDRNCVVEIYHVAQLLPQTSMITITVQKPKR